MKSIENDFNSFQRLSHVSIENAVYGIFWLDAQGRIYRANDAACRQLGYTKDELLGMKVSDFDPDYQAQEFALYWKKLKQTGKYNIESIHKRKDGSYYPAEISSCYIDFEGKGYSCTFFRDITVLWLGRSCTACMVIQETTASMTQRMLCANLIFTQEFYFPHLFLNN